MIKAALATRPEARDNGDVDLMFLAPGGQRWVWTRGCAADLDVTCIDSLHVSRVDRVTAAMGQLCGKLGLACRGHTFYALRHTFETIGGASRGQVAVDAIMGHSRGKGYENDSEVDEMMNSLAQPSPLKDGPERVPQTGHRRESSLD